MLASPWVKGWPEVGPQAPVPPMGVRVATRPLAALGEVAGRWRSSSTPAWR